MSGRPEWWMRRLYRALLWSYDHGLAGREERLGLAWVLLETRGRRTGRLHRVLVDRLGSSSDGRRHFLQSAYAESDWFKNARAAGNFSAEVRGERFDATLEIVDGATAHAVMLAYVRAHPRYAPFIARQLGAPPGLRDPEALSGWLVERFGMLAVRRI